MRHGFRIFPSQSLHLQARGVRAPPSRRPRRTEAGKNPVLERGGGRWALPYTAHIGPLVTSGAGTKPCPWGLRPAATLGVGSSTAQSMALPSLPPSAWPLQAGLAHGCKCTQHSHGEAHTHTQAYSYTSPTVLKNPRTKECQK